MAEFVKSQLLATDSLPMIISILTYPESIRLACSSKTVHSKIKYILPEKKTDFVLPRTLTFRLMDSLQSAYLTHRVRTQLLRGDDDVEGRMTLVFDKRATAKLGWPIPSLGFMFAHVGYSYKKRTLEITTHVNRRIAASGRHPTLQMYFACGRFTVATETSGVYWDLFKRTETIYADGVVGAFHEANPIALK